MKRKNSTWRPEPKQNILKARSFTRPGWFLPPGRNRDYRGKRPFLYREVFRTEPGNGKSNFEVGFITDIQQKVSLSPEIPKPHTTAHY